AAGGGLAPLPGGARPANLDGGAPPDGGVAGAPGAQGIGGPGGAGGLSGNPGWTRLWNDKLGTQVIWLFPLAAGGALLALFMRGRASRTDTRRAAVLL